MAIQALVMGFGGTGAHILTFLKEMTYIKYGDVPDFIQFLYLDTIADWQPGGNQEIQGGRSKEEFAKGREISLDPATEYFYLQDRQPDLKTHVYNYLNVATEQQKVSHLKNWLHAYWFSDPTNIPKAALDIAQGAAQQRQIGRFAMFQNAQQIVNLMSSKIQILSRVAAGDAVNIWIVGSSAGGTGAGCILDAAYMARLASGPRYANHNVRVTGIIVFPNVYTDQSGIVAARAYSLFRDLERMQGVGIGDSPEDKYKDDVVGGDIISRVTYDANNINFSSVDSKLFDYLFYLGKKCQTDPERTQFFSSVAGGVDPYLGDKSGRILLQASVNESGAASSFGASRIYIPITTLTDIFAWEQAKEYLEMLSAPRTEGQTFANVYFGPVGDRQEEARRKVENLLELFGYLREQKDKIDDDIKTITERRIDAQKIVKEFYQLETLGLTPSEKQIAILSIANPYISLTNENVNDVDTEDMETKTFKESKKAKGGKESQEDSRDRFHGELLSITQEYTRTDGGKRSFEQGRRLVYEKLSQVLKDRVDKIIKDEFGTAESIFRDPNREDIGTPLTRLYAELNYILSDEGPLKDIEITIERFIKVLRGKESKYDQKKANALNELQTFKKKLMGPHVDDFQQTARGEMSEYIQWYQKTGLLEDMKKIISQVGVRFKDWRDTLKSIVDQLVLNDHSALYACVENLDRLETRLNLMAKNPTAMISIQLNDTSMQGFREELKKMAIIREGRTLVDDMKGNSEWNLQVDKDPIGLEFKMTLPAGTPETFSDDRQIRSIHETLHRVFKKEIHGRLERIDIFDYLSYLQRKNIDLTAIVNTLNTAAEPLINANQTDDTMLIFNAPEHPDKRNIADGLENKLRGISAGGTVKSSITDHSDETSLALVKVRKPNISQIQDLNTCREDYLRWQRQDLKRVPSEDETLRRAQVFHPFRCELEAWYIERQYSKKKVNRALTEDELIRPRISRLLEYPAMIQAFVECIASGAVEKQDKTWIWHDTKNNRDVFVTHPDVDTNPSLLRAAVVFVLQQREGTISGLIPITLEDAKQSAVDMAQKQEKTKEQAVKEFIDNRLDSFLDEYFPVKGDSVIHQREKQSLKIIFEFYADPDVGTELRDRKEL